MKKSSVWSLGLFFVLALGVVGVGDAFSCQCGCTPGFWKNNTDQWEGFTPDQPLWTVFGEFPDALSSLEEDTLLDALQYPGGPGLEGAARIMLRQAVAALLNEHHHRISHYTWGTVERLVMEALEDPDRDALIVLSAYFMYENELGCPLNAIRTH